MYEGCNKTALCSQKNIAEGFYELLKVKEYSKITASEICKKSGVSRQTFYSLFSSKENIVAFILSREYSFDPGKRCNCKGHPTLQELSQGFYSFIVEKSDFIDLLEKNNIIYLMQKTLYDGFSLCSKEGSDKPVGPILPPELAIEFVASGLTAIAKYYVKNKDSITCDHLSQMIYLLFSGKYFS